MVAPLAKFISIDLNWYQLVSIGINWSQLVLPNDLNWSQLISIDLNWYQLIFSKISTHLIRFDRFFEIFKIFEKIKKTEKYGKTQKSIDLNWSQLISNDLNWSQLISIYFLSKKNSFKAYILLLFAFFDSNTINKNYKTTNWVDWMFGCI